MRYLIFLIGTLFGLQAQANQLFFFPPVTVSANGTSTKYVNQNGLRRYIIVVNNDTTNYAYLKFGSSAQSGTEGIPIPPGGNYEPYIAPNNAMYAVTGGSTVSITVVEGQ